MGEGRTVEHWTREDWSGLDSLNREETAHHRTGSEWKETHGTGLQRRAREARGVERTIFRNSQTNKGLERNEADRRALAGTG